MRLWKNTALQQLTSSLQVLIENVIGSAFRIIQRERALTDLLDLGTPVSREQTVKVTPEHLCAINTGMCSPYLCHQQEGPNKNRNPTRQRFAIECNLQSSSQSLKSMSSMMSSWISIGKFNNRSGLGVTSKSMMLIYWQQRCGKMGLVGFD
jgi:hypothetical protein